MAVHELIINGERVDMSEGTSISLNYKSNLLGAIDKISLNYSLTVSIPVTTRNKTILDMAGVNPASGFPRKKWKCQYIRNCVQIIDGVCYLTSVDTDKYNICMLWGLFAIDTLKDAGDVAELEGIKGKSFHFNLESTKAQELTGIKVATYTEALVSTAPFFANVFGNWGVLTDKYPATALPPVFYRVKPILDMVCDEYGVEFDIDRTSKNLLERLLFPITSRDAKSDDIEQTAVTVDSDFTNSNGSEYVLILAIPMFYGLSRLLHSSGEIESNSFIGVSGNKKYVTAKADGKFSVSFRGDIYTEAGANLVIGCMKTPEGGATGYKNTKLNSVKLEKAGTRADGMDLFIIDETLKFEDVKKGECFAFTITSKASNIEIPNSFKISCNLECENTPYYISIPLADNMPDLKTIDFVKSVCYVLGLFALPPLPGSNAIRLVKADTIQANKGKALDWSRKWMDTNQRPDKMEFALPDYARANTIEYKDTVNGSEPSKGFIYVENETLEKERKMVEIPFNETPNEVPLFTHVQGESGEVEYERERLGNLLMVLTNYNNDAWATVDELTTAEITKRMAGLQDMVRKPVIIKHPFTLTDIDLVNLDYSIPIYLRQTGHYYAIISISNTDNKSEVELLQLN